MKESACDEPVDLGPPAAQETNPDVLNYTLDQFALESAEVSLKQSSRPQSHQTLNLKAQSLQLTWVVF